MIQVKYYLILSSFICRDSVSFVGELRQISIGAETKGF